MTGPGHSKEAMHLTFSQREGVAELPKPLQLGELSQEVRALMWAVIYDSLKNAVKQPYGGGFPWFDFPWGAILEARHVLKLHKAADEYSSQCHHHIEPLKELFFNGTYTAVFEFLEFVFENRICPAGLPQAISAALKRGRAAYTVVDNKAVFPTVTPEEGATLEAAFVALKGAEFSGARAHLLDAGATLNAGDFAASIRQSISAVESVSRVLAPDATTLGPALAALGNKVQLHSALKRAFGALYGYTSEEQGIRHPLLEKGEADVDQEDAVFMLGACAAFISYLTGKGRRAGLIK